MANYLIDKNGTKYYYNDEGKYHRTDGPAIEYSTGGKEWWVCGEKHRLYEPAYTNEYMGTKSYYIAGALYNLYGPAIGDKRYFINSNEITDVLDVIELFIGFINYREPGNSDYLLWKPV